MINKLDTAFPLSVWRRHKKNYHFTICNAGLKPFLNNTEKAERSNYFTDVRNDIFFQQEILNSPKTSKLKILLSTICLANQAFSRTLIKNQPFCYSRRIYKKINQLEKIADVMLQNFLS